MNHVKSNKKILRICKNGHKYYKSTDCPTCPICEANKNPLHGFMALLSAPARRALENNGITTIEELSEYSEKEILKFHGLGKSSIPILKSALSASGLTFNT